MMLDTLEKQLRPAHTALIVVDMQNDFCAVGGYLQRERNYDVSFASALAQTIERTIAGARHASVPVVWIRSVYDFKYLNEPYRVKRKEEGCCMEGSWGADFYHVHPEPDDAIVDKHYFSGFHETRLHALLEEKGIRTLVFAGVATNVCVDSTLREGFFLGYHIVLASDCVDSNSKAGHEGTLATVRNNIGTVETSARILDILAAPGQT